MDIFSTLFSNQLSARNNLKPHDLHAMTYHGQLGILFTKAACFYVYHYLVISFASSDRTHSRVLTIAVLSLGIK